MRKLILSAVTAAVLGTAGAAYAAGGAQVDYLKPGFSWEGVFGRYDQAALKRGFQVYHDVCANCHGLRLVAYRNLAAVGLTEEQIKDVAAEKEVQDGPNDEGAMFMRPARPSDKFVSPFANEMEARYYNNGALPPDLSLINKARVDGPNYIYSLMLGYVDEVPEGAEVPDGMFYNTYFGGHNIAMPPQLMEGLVEYEDGTEATVQQMASDITAFLNWAAEPELNERKSLGLKVMIFLLVLTALLYALKRQIWRDVH